MAKDLLCETALDDAMPAAYYAPTYKMLATFWAEFKAMMTPVISSKDEQLKTLRLINGAVIDFWSLQDDNVSRGRKYKRVVVDEAAITENLETAWNQAIRPTLTDYKGDAWFMSTPKGRQSYFFKLTENEKTKSNWKSFHFRTVDNPYIDPEEVEMAKEDLDALTFTQEYEAEFVELEGNPFFHAWTTERNVQKNYYDPELPIYLSFDFNIRNSLTVYQIDFDKREVRGLEEYQQGGIGMDLEQLCKDVALKYPGAVMIITGDASGNSRNALTVDNQAAYQLIESYLQDAGVVFTSFRVPEANPKTVNARVVCNAVIKHFNITTDPSMTITNADIQLMRMRSDGGLDKAHADKHNYGHAGDTYRYLIYNICYDWYTNRRPANEN
ncbi:hypothetical protein BWI93_05330 [Siphonobacter sp. BAB-5385]|uniref:hypothetical protein n=1 Tax=Siphonobacter sp. BAB-5385 TaxID=1864822 RepID=UPI000B9EC45D|nr:hypothetical protein [Siphonobacter sp. BAB-5385]OZI09169.1 hypothetical protein BWI93_05330 [Siphonobacter sp. BAB-5385]